MDINNKIKSKINEDIFWYENEYKINGGYIWGK